MPLAPTLLRRAGQFALFCATLLPLAASATCRVQSFDIPITMKHQRAVAQLHLNGTEMPFTVDSGAFFSAMTEAAAAQLNLKSHRTGLDAWGVTGRIDFRVTRVERLGLQGSEIKGVDFLVGGNEPGAGTMGLLGRNVLSVGDTEYDLANGFVRLMHPNSDCADADLAYWTDTTPVVEVPLITHLRDQAPPIEAKASINGKSVKVMFDTGARSILSLDAAKRLGVIDDETRVKPAGVMKGAGRGERPFWVVPVASFELGGERVNNIRLLVADMVGAHDFDMLIGIDFFLSHRIYVARSQNRILFTYNGGPVFALSETADTPPTANEGSADAPLDAAGLSHRGAVSAARGDLKGALADLDRAVELAPTVAAYRAQRAQLKLSLRQRDAALVDLDEALRLDPQADEARLDRARVFTAKGAMDSALADLQVLDGRVAAQSDLRRRMGQLFLSLDEPVLAVQQFDQWVASHTREVDLYEVLNSRCWARALANTQLDKALDDCDEALDARPKDAAYLDSRGLVYLRQGKWKKAIADYNAALAQNPKQAWSLWGRGLAQLRAGARDPGLADIAAAKAMHPRIEAETHRHGLDVPADLAAGP